MADDEGRRLLERVNTLEHESADLRIEVAHLKAALVRYLNQEEAASVPLTAEPSPAAATPEPGPRARPSEATGPRSVTGPGTTADPAWRARAASATTTAEGRRAELLDIEFWVGGRGLLLLGVLALVLGVVFFLKYSIDRGWIGPTVRVLLSAAVGVAAVGIGERIRASGYRVYGLWLAAGGFSAIYMSIWAAAGLYALISTGVGFGLTAAVVVAAGSYGVARSSQALLAFAAFGGYLAPLVLQLEVTSTVFALGYLGILSGAGFLIAYRTGWPYLATVAIAGGSIMALPGHGDPHLHGIYLVALVTTALVTARARSWTVLSLLTVLLGWFTLASGRGAFEINGLELTGYAAALWAANLLAIVGVSDWVGDEVRKRADSGAGTSEKEVDLAEISSVALTLVPAGLFYLFAVLGVRESPYRDWQDTVGLLLGLGLGGFYVTLAKYGPQGRGAAQRELCSGLGYALWLIAPALQWSEAALARAWLAEGALLTGFGVMRGAWAMRAAGLAAFVLAGATYFAATGRDPLDPAFISFWALSGLAASLGVGAWSLALGQSADRQKWETDVRPIMFGAAAVLFLGWGTIEIDRFWELAGGERWELARALSISGFWMAYAAALLAAGFAMKRVGLRWAGLAMALIAAVKVFIYDLSVLSQLYRIASFVGLAIVFLVLSYFYQKLQRVDEAAASGEHESSS